MRTESKQIKQDENRNKLCTPKKQKKQKHKTKLKKPQNKPKNFNMHFNNIAEKR